MALRLHQMKTSKFYDFQICKSGYREASFYKFAYFIKLFYFLICDNFLKKMLNKLLGTFSISFEWNEFIHVGVIYQWKIRFYTEVGNPQVDGN